ncbi:MAG UNVERIFIED_CONTAM: hypothetical protein LVR18_37525 [Planctomycetaceae bacterium]
MDGFNRLARRGRTVAQPVEHLDDVHMNAATDVPLEAQVSSPIAAAMPGRSTSRHRRISPRPAAAATTRPEAGQYHRTHIHTRSLPALQ